MTATRTRADDIALVVTTPLPDVVEVVTVAVVHRSRQHRSAIAQVVEERDHLELVAEIDDGGGAADQLASAMPDVAVVELDAVGSDGLADLVSALPAIGFVAVSDDDGGALGDALLRGAVAVATTTGGHAHIADVLAGVHHRRASVTQGAAVALVAQIDGGLAADVPLDGSELLRDLAAGQSLAEIASTADVAVSELANRLSRTIVALRRSAG